MRASFPRPQFAAIAAEKDAIEKKLARMEKSKDSEARDLQGKLQTVQDSVRQQLRQKDAKLNEVSRGQLGSG